MVTEIICGNCKYFEPLKLPVGECRRHIPPWVEIQRSDWCGEAEPIEITPHPEVTWPEDACPTAAPVVEESRSTVPPGQAVIPSPGGAAPIPPKVVHHHLYEVKFSDGLMTIYKGENMQEAFKDVPMERMQEIVTMQVVGSVNVGFKKEE